MEESRAIVNAAIEAWNRSDFDTWIGAWDERAEFHPLRAQSQGRAYRGHDGLRRFATEMTEEWQEVRFDVDEIRGAGEQVVALGHVRARLGTSDVERDLPLALVAVVRDEKLVYARCAAMGSGWWPVLADSTRPSRTSRSMLHIDYRDSTRWS